MRQKVTIGNCAGHHFWGPNDLQVCYHVTATLADGRKSAGLFYRRKSLVNRAAFEYDPQMGWEVDCWFDWTPRDGYGKPVAQSEETR